LPASPLYNVGIAKCDPCRRVRAIKHPEWLVGETNDEMLRRGRDNQFPITLAKTASGPRFLTYGTNEG
jgi:hypothetical protein